MPLTPWHKVIDPREDLREGKPLDASEFAVHLDQVRDGSAPAEYRQAAKFFERTYMTRNLGALAVEAVRRLNGVKVETSAVFNLATQFGGGKTHALTLLYHLARGGKEAHSWKGVPELLRRAKVDTVPVASTAVFVGTEVDSLAGRGGDGEPLRKTPWGEIAFQLGGAESFALVEEHDRTSTAPGGDVIRKMLPQSRPVLILIDELMNFVSRWRRSAQPAQLYTFLQNLSEVARSRDNVVLAVSIPGSELEMNTEDESDYTRLKKLLDRLGKSLLLSAETETAEIIRRRLFEWNGLPEAAAKTVGAYADWVVSHRQQLPSWFAADRAREAFAATYPFHPSVLSVFERKWRALPRFQQTRGVLRLLALWVSQVHSASYRRAHKDPLITLGTAPLGDPMFRSAVFSQLGEERLEAAVTTDIDGKDHAHALRLDAEATVELKKARLHRKVATSIFFESNGGQSKGEATVPELRLAVAEPDLNIGNVEQCLDTLADTCYYLIAQRARYRFSFRPNLNQVLADRLASVPASSVRERIRAQVQKVFSSGPKADRVWFPEQSNDIPDRPALTFVVAPPELTRAEPSTLARLEALTRDHGASARTYKSALVWCVAEDSAPLLADARKLLAWEDIDAEAVSDLKLDEDQGLRLKENLLKAQRDLIETVWRVYKNVFVLDETNTLDHIDLGLVHSSQSNDGLLGVVRDRLQEQDLVIPDAVSASFLGRNWPPALPEWSTKAVRDVFFASPKYPRLLNPEAVKMTIVRGVEAGLLAYVTRQPDGSYEPFYFKTALQPHEVEITDDVFILRKEDAEDYLARQQVPQSGETGPSNGGSPNGPELPGSVPIPGQEPDAPIGPEASPVEMVKGFRWSGEITHFKWMNFYTKVLSPFANAGGLTLSITVEASPDGGISKQRLEETRIGLRDLGVNEDELEILE